MAARAHADRHNRLHVRLNPIAQGCQSRMSNLLSHNLSVESEETLRPVNI
jgi:hypothetical protein